MRSATLPVSLAFCSASSTVSAAARFLERPSDLPMTMGARPSEGSSKHQRGSGISPIDTASICCCPPDSVPAS